MKNHKPDSNTRARARARAQTRTRRLSACYRHPDEPVTGICAACLRERLSGLDPSGDPSAIITTITFPSELTKPAGDSSSPELRRCRSVSTAKSEASCSYYTEPRRKSCDVRARNSLSDLFDVDDEKDGSIGSANVESKNLGFSNLSNEVIQPIEEDEVGEEARVSDDTLPLDVIIADDFDDNVGEGEVKTMKEFIDLEVRSKNEKPKELRNLWEAASVFSKKLRKWRQKQKNKELSEGNEGGIDGDNGKNRELKPRTLRDVQSEAVDYALGRRSCDTDPRFRAGRISVEGSRISFDEPRASWDGYMIDGNTRRLGGMLSFVENGTLGCGNRFDSHRLSVDGQMQSIIEDESSSGGSGQSNSDFSSSSQRRSSFDRSSSVRSLSKKTVGLESDEANSVLNVKMSPPKLVITERELKDWRLKSVKDDSFEKFEPVGNKAATSVEAGGNLNGSKKSTRWRKMCNVLGLRPKSSETKCGNSTGSSMDSLVADEGEKQGRENGGKVIEASVCKLTRSGSVASSRKSLDMVGLNQCRRNGEDVKEASDGKLMRSGSVASSRRSFDMIGLNRGMRSVLVKDNGSENNGGEDFVLELNKSGRSSLCKIDGDVVPFYLAPLRSSKSGRHRPQNSLSITGDMLPLN